MGAHLEKVDRTTSDALQKKIDTIDATPGEKATTGTEQYVQENQERGKNADSALYRQLAQNVDTSKVTEIGDFYGKAGELLDAFQKGQDPRGTTDWTKDFLAPARSFRRDLNPLTGTQRVRRTIPPVKHTTLYNTDERYPDTSKVYFNPRTKVDPTFPEAFGIRRPDEPFVGVSPVEKTYAKEPLVTDNDIRQRLEPVLRTAHLPTLDPRQDGISHIMSFQKYVNPNKFVRR